jgi:hypothetical protein
MHSSGAQYVALQKYFSRRSLVIYFFANATHKTKTGIAITSLALVIASCTREL